MKQFTRKESILDLIWTNSCCPRNIRVIKNVLLTDHDTVLMDFTVTKPENEREAITNPYSTKINLYDLEKLTDEGWRNIVRHLVDKDWGNITNTSVSDL